MSCQINDQGRVVTSLGEMLSLGGQWDNYWGGWWECDCGAKWSDSVSTCAGCFVKSIPNYHRFTVKQIEAALANGTAINIGDSFRWPTHVPENTPHRMVISGIEMQKVDWDKL